MLSPDASRDPADPAVLPGPVNITPGILPTGTRSSVLFSTPPALDSRESAITGADGVDGADEAGEPDDPEDPEDPEDPPAELGDAPAPGIIASVAPWEGPVTDIIITATGTCLPSFSTA
jgi:hypothetical protein